MDFASSALKVLPLLKGKLLQLFSHVAFVIYCTPSAVRLRANHKCTGYKYYVTLSFYAKGFTLHCKLSAIKNFDELPFRM